MSKTLIEQAIEKAGSPGALAAAIGVNVPVIYHWRKNGIPPLKDAAVERYLRDLPGGPAWPNLVESKADV
jgi:hypothetical protein